MLYYTNAAEIFKYPYTYTHTSKYKAYAYVQLSFFIKSSNVLKYNVYYLTSMS